MTNNLYDPNYKEKHLKYYRTKFQNHFSPAVLEFHLNKLYNQAVQKFDPNKAQFQTILSAYMNKMSRVSNNKGGLIKNTEYSKTNKTKVIKMYNELKTLKHKVATPEYIAKKLNMPTQKVKQILNNNEHASIIQGNDTTTLEIDPNKLLHGLSEKEQRVLDSVSKNMSPEQAYKYTGLSKTLYYEHRKKIQNQLREAYLKNLKDYTNVISSH